MAGDRQSWLRKMYQRIPFFAQCLFSYFLIMVIFFAALFLISNRAQDIARQNYLNERRYALQTSAESFSRQMENFRAIPLALQRTPYYTQLRLLTQDKVGNRHYYAMNSLRVTFSQQCALLELENNAFIYFRNSGAVVSNRSFSFDAGCFFGDMIAFAGASGPEFVRGLQRFGEMQGLLTLQAVSGEEITPGDYLLYLYKHQDESAVYGLLLERAAIERLFRLSELPEGTELTFLKQNQVLFSGGCLPDDSSGEKEYLSYPVPGLNLTVRLGIPAGYFSELTASLTALNRTYILLSLGVGLALSVLLSLFGQMPVRQLLRLSPGNADTGEIKNEFLALGRCIRQSADENQQLRQQIDSGKNLLRLNLLARLLAQESYTASDEALAAEHLPQLARPSRILCLQLIPSERENGPSDFVSFHAVESVQRLFCPACLMVQMRSDLIALLTGDDEKTLAFITEAAVALREDLNTYGVSLAAGLSEPFQALDFLHDAYLHAQFTLRYFNPPLPIFHPAEDTEPFRFIDLSRFQNAVIGCEESLALTQLDHLLDCAGHSSWVPRALHFILDSICAEMKLPPADPNAPLHMRTAGVIRALSARRDEYANTLLDSILAYLNANFSDSSLSAESVSTHFGVSKSYLYRTFRETLNMTLTDQLEQIRMARANELLLTTKMSVNAVAADCGYNSANTFYKAYKKCYNRSPNAARPGASAPREAEETPPFA